MKVQSTDIKDFEIIFKRNYQRLCHFAYQYLEDEEEAKDVVNDVFEAAWRNYPQLEKHTMDAYLYTAVRNRCLNHLEHDRVKCRCRDFMAILLEEEETDAEVYEEWIGQIDAACRKMPEKTRYILNQCYFHHKKYKEVAEELQVTTDAVKKHIVKALKILRASVRKDK